MAEKHLYIGSVGPYIFDDAETYPGSAVLQGAVRVVDVATGADSGKILISDSNGVYKDSELGSVQSYTYVGAGDGVSDFSTDLQQAIDDAAAAGVFMQLTRGVYPIGTGLILTPGCKGIVGPGSLKALGAGMKMLQVNSGAGVEVKGVEFDANGVGSFGIHAASFADSLIQFNQFIGFNVNGSVAVALRESCTGNLIYKNRMEMATASVEESIGIQLSSPKTDARTSVGNTTAGYVDVFTGSITASDKTLVITTPDFVAGDVGKLVVVEGAGGAGSHLVTTIASFTNSTTVELVTAAVDTVSGAGVNLNNAVISRPTISNKRNKVVKNEILNGTHSIHLQYSDHNEVLDNICDTQQDRCIISIGASHNLFSGNKGFEVDSTGIHFAYGCDHNQVVENEMKTDSIGGAGGDNAAYQVYVSCNYNLFSGNKAISEGGGNPWKYGFYLAVNCQHNKVWKNDVDGAEVGYAEETDWQDVLPAGATYSRVNAIDYVHAVLPSEHNECKGNTFNVLGCGIYLAQVDNKAGQSQNLKHTVVEGNTVSGDATHILFVFEESGTVDKAKLRNLDSDATSTAKFSATRGRAHFDGARIENVALLDDNIWRTLTGSTPSIKFGRYFNASNGAATNLNRFVDGSAGQIIYVQFDGNTTVANNSFIQTTAEAATTPSAGTILCFVIDDALKAIQQGGLPGLFHFPITMDSPLGEPFGYGLEIDSAHASFGGEWARHFVVRVDGDTKLSIGAKGTAGVFDFGFIGGDLADGSVPSDAADQWVRFHPTSKQVEIPNGPVKLGQISAPGVTTDQLYNVAGDLFWDGFQLNVAGAAGDITAVNAGDGLTGGGASGDVTVTLDTPVALARGGLGVALADPNADRILFWDESANAIAWLSLGTTLSLVGTAMGLATNVAVTLTALWTFDAGIELNDSDKVLLGTGSDFQLYHDGVNNLIDITNGNLTIRQQVNSGKIILAADDSLGTQREVLEVNGNEGLKVTYGDFLLTSPGVIKIGGNQVLSSRDTGWGSPTGTSSKAAFDPSTVTLEQLGQRVKALIEALKDQHQMISA